MDWRGIPSLNSLRAFSAVADTLSFSRAGRELNVSHAAVSQQVRALEANLGAPLVTRQGRGVALTAEGKELATRLEKAFVEIRDAVDALSDTEAGRPLQVTMTPTFAVSWLMPRIGDFRMEHPDIEMMLNPTSEVIDLAPGGVDIAIRYGDGNWKGVDAEMLLPTTWVVVASTRLVGDKEFTAPEQLIDYPWLQELGTNELSMWLERQGVIAPGKLDVTHMPGWMMLESLKNGAGITASARAFLEPDIKAGTLRVLFEDEARGSGYFIVTRPGVLRPSAKIFLSWLRRHGADSFTA
ncbi:LysR family transcriptional regulator [Oricola sp.]|uniref:LysR family transcriptional regulator n=1 Tax=Oricola sp. TaxID=1979950 RepID=UPI003BA98DEA